jgi:leucyl-tRNA synthetase
MVIKDGAKMSKSKGNVVSADSMIEKYGADIGRVFELFAAPPEREMDWTDTGAEGALHFLGRVYRLVTRSVDRMNEDSGEAGEADAIVLRKLHQTIQQITEDFESRWHFNTSIAAIMKLVNEVYAQEAKLSGPVLKETLENLVLLMEPFAPYLAEEMWEDLGRTGPVFKQPWPDYDPELARDPAADVVIQVNGKVRGRIAIAFGTPNEALEKAAMTDKKIEPLLHGKTVLKVIVVPDKLVNIVVR